MCRRLSNLARILARREKARLVTRLIAGPLILCICTLFVLSFFTGFSIGCGRSRWHEGFEGHSWSNITFDGLSGRFMLVYRQMTTVMPGEGEYSEKPASQVEWILRGLREPDGTVTKDPTTRPAVLGFGWMNEPVEWSSHTSGTITAMIVPGWVLVSLCAIPAVRLLLNTLIIRKRLRNGQCQMCGYDLFASPDRCPECGT